MWAAAPPPSPTSFTTHNSSQPISTTFNIPLPPPQSQRWLVSFGKSRWGRRRGNCHGTADDEVVCSKQDNVGAVGKAVVTAFKIKAQQQQMKPCSSSSALGVGVERGQPSGGHKRREKTSGVKQEESEETAAEKRQLSGSDVLWALQRASAEKAKKHRQQQQQFANHQEEEEEMRKKRRRRRRAVEVDHHHNNGNDTSTSGPPPDHYYWLSIKSEWGARLEELDKRLEELLLMDV